MQNSRVKRKSKVNLAKRVRDSNLHLSVRGAFAFHTHPITGQNHGIVERGWRIIFSHTGIRQAKNVCGCGGVCVKRSYKIPLPETIK